ncbi:MAG: nucleotidyltransferase domain-containing protein [Chloroflexi bacterium]|nr:nucleotidyltransferase domain-containing protein [Chloroflexota bacterium]
MMKEARPARQKVQTASRRRKPRVDVAGLAEFFAQQPDVVVAYLFGSVAKGTARAQSDVDVAVLLDERLTPLERGGHYLALLGLDRFADRSLDVRLLNETTPLFCSQVVKHGQVIYERTRAERIAFEVRTMANYADTQPMREFFTQDLYQRIREGKIGERRRRYHSGMLENARRLQRQTARNTAH